MYKKQVKHQKALDRARELKAEKAAYRAGNRFLWFVLVVIIALGIMAFRDTTPKNKNNVSHHIFNEP
ncbi:hypothetical protein [Mesonia mobilis]|uniref:hypothetical protein n=1 Tax=Mesonia mobilis TaxID=369791 RepID=UPI0024B9D932|nr:hypothetical protein [Mesonia mobilis]